MSGAAMPVSLDNPMRAPSVGVIIVSYRTAALTIAALRSIDAERSATHLTIRAVVVDNASGDLPLIAQAVAANGWSSWVSLVASSRNAGFAYGNNLGIEHVYADGAPSYLYLLNPDAQVRAGAIVSLTRFMEHHPDAGIAGGSFENLDGSEWKIAFRFPTLLSELCDGLQLGVVARLLRRWRVPVDMANTPQRVDWICGASMLVRPEVLIAVGGFDERYFLYFEETDFCYRARQAGFSTWYVPQSRVMHIRGQSTRVTDLNKQPTRLPPYWFESRRRYFTTTFGTTRAAIIDCVAVLAHCLGWLKQRALRHREAIVPHFIRDLLHHSVLWPRNRRLLPGCYRHVSTLVSAAQAAAGGDPEPREDDSNPRQDCPRMTQQRSLAKNA